MKYFSVHVFFSRKDGYSVPVAIKTDEDELSDDYVIEFAVTNGLLESADADQVDCIDEIDEVDYIDMIL